MDGEQPAGWYPSPDPARRASHARYWDGTRWTDHEVLVEDVLEGALGGGPGDAPGDTVAAQDATATGPGGGRQLLARLAVALLVVAVALPPLGTWLERAGARGPVVVGLEDATSWNRLINPPDIVVRSGPGTHRRQLTVRADGAFVVVPNVEWTLDERLLLDLVPLYPSEEQGRVVLDLRENGARRLGQGWPVRVLVVATDTTFEIEISQPVVRGIQRSREVVHRSSVPRSNEGRLAAAVEAEERARADAIALRQACERELREEWTERTAPTGQLQLRYVLALEEREIYGTGTITFDEYRRRIRNVASDMQEHLREAERGLEGLPASLPLADLDDNVMVYAALREAWLDFERALRTVRTGPGATFQSLYPTEAGAIERFERELDVTSGHLGNTIVQAIADAASSACAALHPLP